jgi:hypothetical protein
MMQPPSVRPDADRASRLLAEAQREIRPGHELEGVELVECLARCSGCENAVFRRRDESFRCHLADLAAE